MLKSVSGKVLDIVGSGNQTDLIFQMVTPSSVDPNILPINKSIRISTNNLGEFSIDLLSSPAGITYSCTLADRQVILFILKDSTPSPYFLTNAYPRII